MTKRQTKIEEISIHFLLPVAFRSGGRAFPSACPSYTPPVGNNIEQNFTMAYSPPTGNNVQLEFCATQ